MGDVTQVLVRTILGIFLICLSACGGAGGTGGSGVEEREYRFLLLAGEDGLLSATFVADFGEGSEPVQVETDEIASITVKSSAEGELPFRVIAVFQDGETTVERDLEFVVPVDGTETTVDGAVTVSRSAAVFERVDEVSTSAKESTNSKNETNQKEESSPKGSGTDAGSKPKTPNPDAGSSDDNSGEDSHGSPESSPSPTPTPTVSATPTPTPAPDGEPSPESTPDSEFTPAFMSVEFLYSSEDSLANMLVDFSVLYKSPAGNTETIAFQDSGPGLRINVSARDPRVHIVHTASGQLIVKDSTLNLKEFRRDDLSSGTGTGNGKTADVVVLLGLGLNKKLGVVVTGIQVASAEAFSQTAVKLEPLVDERLVYKSPKQPKTPKETNGDKDSTSDLSEGTPEEPVDESALPVDNRPQDLPANEG